MPSEEDYNSSWSIVNHHNRRSQQVIACIMESTDDVSGSARSTISNEKSAKSASTVPTSNLSATDLTTVVRHMDEKFEMLNSNLTLLRNNFDNFKHLVLPNIEWKSSSSLQPSACLNNDNAKPAASKDVIDLSTDFDTVLVHVCHQKAVASIMDHGGPNGVYAMCLKPTYLTSITGGLNSRMGKSSVESINKAVAYLTATLLTRDPGTKGYVYPEPLDLNNQVSKMQWDNVYREIPDGSYILSEVVYGENQFKAAFFVVGYKRDETFRATAVSLNEKDLDEETLVAAKSKLIEVLKTMDSLQVQDKEVEVHVLNKSWLAIPFTTMGAIGTVGEHALYSFFPSNLSTMKSTWIRAYVNVRFLLCLTSEKKIQLNDFYESLCSGIEAGSRATTMLHLLYNLFLEAAKVELVSVAVDATSLDEISSIGFINPLPRDQMIEAMQRMVDDCKVGDTVSSPPRSPPKKQRTNDSHADAASRELGKLK